MRNITKLKVIGIVCILLVVSIIAVSAWGGKLKDASQGSQQGQTAAQSAAQREGVQEASASAQSASLSTEYQKVAENDRLILFLKEDNLAIRLQEKQSGYVWSSVIEDQESKDNVSWRNFMASGLSIDYFKKDIPEPNRTDLRSEKNKSVAVTTTKDGFSAQIRFIDLKISLELDVKLDGEQLIVGVPNRSIRESGDFTLASVYAYPFLGATRLGEVPGYMFIPDGSGALISLQDNKEKFKHPYEAKIYGANDGIEPIPLDKLTNQPYPVQFPVFGIVHGERKHGMFAVVENGQFNAKIISYPNGVNTQYNWITAEYLLREAYVQPTNRAMDGFVVHEKNRNLEDMQTRYFFLNGKEADYVGMSKTYRNYLQSKGVLKLQSGTDKSIPIQLDFLGAESKNGLFFKQIIPMTTVAQLTDIMTDVKKNGIDNPIVVYKGWNKGGFSGTNPSDVTFEKKLGTAKEFAELMTNMKKQGVPLHFYDDYTTAFDDSGRFSARVDAAKKVDKTVLEIQTNKDVYKNYYFMSTDKSVSVLERNIGKYADKGIGNIAVGNTGSILFSEWDGRKVKSRADMANIYMDMMKHLSESSGSVLLYSPNDYMLKYADQVLNVPMHSSQYIYTNETVPFEQMVLKGYKDYFAPYANFFGNPKLELLRMVEYGAYPSYYLTHESSYKLKFTNSNDVYTSSYNDWKEDMISTYQTINTALKPVRNATIEDRIVPAPGVVKMVYSNKTEIIINYSDADFNANGVSVPAKGFKVIEVKR